MSDLYLQKSSRLMLGSALSRNLQREAARAVTQPMEQPATRIRTCPVCSRLMIPAVTCTTRVSPTAAVLRTKNKNRRARARMLKRVQAMSESLDRRFVHYMCMFDKGRVAVPAYVKHARPAQQGHVANTPQPVRDKKRQLAATEQPGITVGRGLSLKDFLL